MASRMKLKFKKDHFHRLKNRKTPASHLKKTAVKSSHRTRVDWHQYFMNIASEVATRSTCDRKHVGAVIVRDKTILSTGYNGSVRGLPHCDDQGHMMEDGHCVATIHAEANAIIQAAKNGVRVDGADIYITASPCWNCFKIVTNAGIKNIYYGEFYRDDRIFDAAKQLKMLVSQIKVPKAR
jgi:dCMP deaminase